MNFLRLKHFGHACSKFICLLLIVSVTTNCLPPPKNPFLKKGKATGNSPGGDPAPILDKNGQPVLSGNGSEGVGATQPDDPAIVQEGEENAVFAAIMTTIDKDTCSEGDSNKPSTRIITRDEWVDTVSLAFGVTLDAERLTSIMQASTISSAVTWKEFNHLRNFNKMSAVKLEAFSKAGKLAADAITSSKGEAIVNCGSGTPRACVATWLTKVIPTLWNVPAIPTDINALATFFESAGANKPALSRLIERVLLSHQFLYRSYLGLGGQLTSWEVASALADSLWNSPVTPDLAALANADALKTKADIERQIVKMIGDPRFYSGLKRFVRSWLRSETIADKDFKPEQKIAAATQQELVEESTNYLYHLIRSKSDSFENLFTSKFTVGGEAMAAAYGFPSSGAATATPKSSKLMKLSLPEGRHGLLGQPGFITMISSLESSNPPRRGQSVMSIFMCQSLVTPENLAETVAKVGANLDPNLSVVDAYHKVTSASPVCSGCHIPLNGIGFGIEDVGPTGFSRILDDRKHPVVAKGALVNINGSKVQYEGIGGLGRVMSESKDAKACMTLQMFRMINARVETRADACSIAGAYKKASLKEFTFSEIFAALLTEKSFLTRTKAGE